jgi:predicted component of type VI protein secretion system
MLGIRVLSFDDVALDAPHTAAFDEAGGDIGRAAHCTLTLPDNERQISRRQALIRCVGGRYTIRSIGTNLAVELNGLELPIDVDYPLEIGARIRIGPYELRAEAATAQPADAPVQSPIREVDLFLGDSTSPADLGLEAPAHEPAREPAGLHADLYAALYEGLGLPAPAPAGQTPQQLRLVGALLRQAIAGTLDLLTTRAAAKRELGTGATMPHARENNPLKFSVDVDTALAHLLGPSQRGFMDPLPAVTEALGDLRAHDVAVLASMRAGLAEVMARFDPAALERQLLPSGSLEKLLPGSRDAKLWAHYAKRYAQIQQDLETDVDALLSRAFQQAYEAQLDHLTRARLRGPAHDH